MQNEDDEASVRQENEEAPARVPLDDEDDEYSEERRIRWDALHGDAVFNCGLVIQAREARGIPTSPARRKALVDSVMEHLLAAPPQAPLENLRGYLRRTTLERIEAEKGLSVDELLKREVRNFRTNIELHKLMKSHQKADR